MLSLSLWVDAGFPSVLPEPQEQSTLLMGAAKQRAQHCCPGQRQGDGRQH